MEGKENMDNEDHEEEYWLEKNTIHEADENIKSAVSQGEK
jgi:hypothetical protein